MSEPDTTRDDFPRFECECPNCGRSLPQLAERCPHCGQDLIEAFSGTFRPRRGRGMKIVAAALLAVFVAAMLAAAIGMALR